MDGPGRRSRPERGVVFPSVRADRIILVYNEDSGLFNAVSGWAHKAFQPGSFQCALCRATFGLTGMLVPWRTFLERLPCQRRFLHRDQFRASYPALAETALPAILIEEAGHCETLIGADEIRSVGGVAGLISLMQARLENHLGRDHAS